MSGRHLLVTLGALTACALLVAPHATGARYGSGVTDAEIKIGQTMAYSGPASALGTFGKTMAAYFAKLNDEGGVNGRKIRLLSLDDGYAPPKAVEQTRRLVEQDEVLMLFGSLGTASNLAVQKYLNANKVPQLFLITGVAKLSDPERFPWTMGFVPGYQLEGATYARHLLETRPEAKVALLYQNDDYGKDLRKGFREALAGKAPSMIVAESSFEVTEPTVDQQVISLLASGADTLVTFATPKAGAQAIRKVSDLGWKPLHIVSVGASSMKGSLQPAGVDKAVGLISARVLKDADETDWANDVGMRDYLAFMKKYYPEGDPSDPFNTMAYTMAETLVHVLKRCENDLTRENVLRQATSINGLELPLLLPGVRISTSPTDYRPFKQLQLARFDGRHWVRFGRLLGE